MILQHKRKHPRAPARITATMAQQGLEPVQMEVIQISEGGLFLKTEKLPTPGSRFLIEINLPNGGVEPVMLEVRTIIKKGQYRPDPTHFGMGCSFANASEKFKDFVRQHIKKMQGVYKQLQFKLALSNATVQSLGPLRNDALLDRVHDIEQIRKQVKREIKNLFTT